MFTLDEKKELELKQLIIHETMEIDDCTTVLKVPGGLIYKFYTLEEDNLGNDYNKLISTVYIKFKY